MAKNQNNNGGTNSGMPKVAFWTIILVAILLLVSMILHFVGINSVIVGWLQAVASLVLFVVAALVGWRYCRHTNIGYKLLYLVCVILILVCTILPRVI